MNFRPIVPFARPLLLASLTLAALGTAAHAQLMVNMSLSKKVYVAHEPIIATVTVKNLAGHDLILSAPGGGGWLNFDVRRGSSGISRRPDAPSFKAYALKAGGTVTRTINLGQHYPLGLPSNYAVTASVYYPPLKRFFSSQRLLVNVTKAKVIWTQSFGVRQGNNRPVKFNKYALLSHRDHNSSSLYVSVASEDGTAVYATYSLGRVLRSFDPNVDIDGTNRLHVLHLGGPQLYAHSVVDTDGTLVRQDIFKETTQSRPVLRNSSGSISVRGGIKYDPNNPTGALSTASRQDDPNRIRKATERPEGLPLPRK